MAATSYNTEKQTTKYNGKKELRALGCAESYYNPSFLTPEQAASFFARIQEEVKNDYERPENMTFSIFGKTMRLPRKKAFYGDVQDIQVTKDGDSNNNSNKDNKTKSNPERNKKKRKKPDEQESTDNTISSNNDNNDNTNRSDTIDTSTIRKFPLYRYGGSYIPLLSDWRPSVKEIRDLLEKETGVHCNHCVLNLYETGANHIGLHHDKVKDFREGASVYTVSLGAVRTLRLQRVKDSSSNRDKQERGKGEKEEKEQDAGEDGEEGEGEEAVTEDKVDIELQPGSLFCLGPQTNAEYKHAILQTKQEVCPRISLTFRDVVNWTERTLQ